MMHKKDAVWRKLFYSIEDYDLWLKLNSEGKKFYNIFEPLVMHRIHENSSFNSKNNSSLINTLLLYWKKRYNYQTQNQIIETKIININNTKDLRNLNTQKYQKMYKIGNKIYYS